MSLDEVLKCGSNFEISPACADDQLLLLGGLGECRARERGRNGPGGPESGGALEKIAASELHAGFLPGSGSVMRVP